VCGVEVGVLVEKYKSWASLRIASGCCVSLKEIMV